MSATRSCVQISIPWLTIYGDCRTFHTACLAADTEVTLLNP